MDYKELMEKINEAVKMSDLLEEFGTTLRTPMVEEQISCPFHGRDSKPSCRHYPDTNTIYCFTCKKSWDPIRFIMGKRGMRFKEALDYFGKKYGIETAGLTYNADGSKTLRFLVATKGNKKEGISIADKLEVAKGALEDKILMNRHLVPLPKYLTFVYLMSHMWCMEDHKEFLPMARKVSGAIDRITTGRFNG